MLCTGGTSCMAELARQAAPVERRPHSSATSRNERTKALPGLGAAQYTMSTPRSRSPTGQIGTRHSCQLFAFRRFVSLPGTDTMAYAATALAFMLEISVTRRLYGRSNTPLHALFGRPTKSNHGSHLRVRDSIACRSHHILSRSSPGSLSFHQVNTA
jgi:hypothetical protein